jgi:Ser/Thr protein kinase RdoA (MazF antagonist)
MMQLALMTAFFESVDRDGRSPIAGEIAGRWFQTPPVVRCLRASANFVFRVEAGSDHYILRFNLENERRVEEIAAELRFTGRLAGHDVLVAEPVAARSGLLVEAIPTELGTFHAVMLEALSGRHLALAELDSAGLARWGRALGELHNASQGYSACQRPNWSDHISFARAVIPPAEELLQAELGEVEKRLHGLAAGPEDFGLIHYDFELDNLLWQADQIGVVDFDDCAYYWFAADIAYALRDLFDDCAEGVDLGDQRVGSFVDGYRSARPISDEQLGHVPLLMRLHNLIAFARISRSLAGGRPAEEPEWAAGLRGKLAGKLTAHRRSVAEHPLSRLGR